MPMLYEATSPRNDNAIWALTYGEPSIIGRERHQVASI